MIAPGERFIRYRRPVIVAAHAALFAVAYALAFLLRFDFRIPADVHRDFLVALPWVVAVELSAVAAFHLYEGLWRYVGVRDAIELVKALSLAAAVSALGIVLMLGHGFPRSVVVLNWMLSLGFAGGIRVYARVLLERAEASAHAETNGNGHRARVLVAGAGDLAEALLRELERRREPFKAVALLDDDPRLRGRRLHGVQVMGSIADLEAVAKRTDPNLVLIASADREDKRRVAEVCRRIGLEVKAVPGLQDILKGRAFIEQFRAVRPEDLLGRDRNGGASGELQLHLLGRRVLVTGAAGSIGSEIARQVASFAPERLVILDRNESDLYFAALELTERFPEIEIVAQVGDITDERFIRRVLRDVQPQLVYHAAAYKHVPLMESQPLAAVKNNVFGTEMLALASIDAGVERFVNISTDKAVDPVSVMGLSKRAAETIVAGLAGQGTTFVSVRFGNVLGSRGSVLPIFNRQIERGVPITVTDTDATRYFMLISEAVELVLQAGRLGSDGEVYVLDMGEPLRITDLAENLVRLAGLEPHVDVPIDVVGLRPGERLHENAGVGRDEVSIPAQHDRIRVVRKAGTINGLFSARLNELRERFIAEDAAGCVESLRAVASAPVDELRRQ